MRITLAQLYAANACLEQVALFESMFGEEVEVTIDLCIKHALDFDFMWAIHNLLSEKAMVDSAKARLNALNAIIAARRQATDDYNNVVKAAKDEDGTILAAFYTYREARRVADVNYRKAIAIAFADALAFDERQQNGDK